jgi:hypothetical protein
VQYVQSVTELEEEEEEEEEEECVHERLEFDVDGRDIVGLQGSSSSSSSISSSRVWATVKCQSAFDVSCRNWFMAVEKPSAGQR